MWELVDSKVQKKKPPKKKNPATNTVGTKAIASVDPKLPVRKVAVESELKTKQKVNNILEDKQAVEQKVAQDRKKRKNSDSTYIKKKVKGWKRPEGPIGVDASVAAPPSVEWLRRVAAIKYSSNPHGIKLEELCRDPVFRDVPIDLLKQWYVADKWEDQRSHFFDLIRENLQERLIDPILNEQSRIMDVLENLEKMALYELTNHKPRMNSFEGGIKAILQILMAREQLATSMISTVMPKVADRTMDKIKDNIEDLSDDELRIAAHAIIKARNQKIGIDQAAKEATEEVINGAEVVKEK